MNLLASPWSDAIERAAMAFGKKNLRAPLVAVAASVLLVTVGNATIAAQVSEASEKRTVVRGERAALERDLVAAHLREERLKNDISLVRRIAAIERNDRRMLESVAIVANDAPGTVWFDSLTVDHHMLTIEAKTVSITAISAMLRSTSQRRDALLPRVRSVLRSADVSNPILGFTMDIQHTPPAGEHGTHDRT